jgi:transcriptional regulator with XRE-family HTH domain
MTQAESIGKYLKELREKKKISLEEARKATRIKVESLEAIESGEIAKRVPPVYAKALVKAYGDFLGADGEELAKRLVDAGGVGSSEVEAVAVTSRIRGGKVAVQRRSFHPLTIGIVAVVAVIILYCLFVAVFYPYSITVKAKGRVPVEVYRDGKLVWAPFIEGGRVKSWRGRRSIRVKIYRAEDARVIYKSRGVKLPGEGGVVVEVDHRGIRQTPFSEPEGGPEKGR